MTLVRARSLLRDAVAIASPSGSEAAVAAYLVERMRGFCDRAFLDGAGNAVGECGHGPLVITVLGHIDTVPGDIAVRVAGDVLYGRGSVDAKGPFCAALAAASRLGADVRARITLRLIGAVEEEAPSSRGARYALRAYPAPDLLLIAEPSGWDALTLGYKGRLMVRLAADLPNAHSAADRVTSPEALVDAWLRLRAWATAATGGGGRDGEGGVFDSVQATLQSFTTTADGLRQQAVATVGLRLPPAWPPGEAAAALRELAWPEGVDLAVEGGETAYRGPRDTVLTRAFRVAIRRHGGSPRTNVKTGTSDMNVVAPAWPVPTLAYGPGDSAQDHTPSEHLDLREYDRAVAVLAIALERISLGGSPQRSGATSPTVRSSSG